MNFDFLVFLLLFFIICQVKSSVVDLNNTNNRNFEMPEMKTDKISLPKFSVKDSKLPTAIARKLQIPGMGGGGGSPGPAPIVAPVQFPGILNPDIYIQNTQSAPVFPQVTAPPVSMNLHINGLEKYYSKTPQHILHVHHVNTGKTNLKQMLNELYNKHSRCKSGKTKNSSPPKSNDY